MNKSLLLLPLLVAVAYGGAVELTEDNFDAEVFDSGKGAFIKFLAPWWGHCKKMKPAWDKLGDEFADSKTVIIADVDCTTDGGKPVCSKFGVRGYPTIKYFTSSTDPLGDAYEGGRDFDSMKAFASENLGPSCGDEHYDLCNDEQKKAIDDARAMTVEEREAAITEKSDAIAAAEKNFEDELKKLQDRYQELSDEKDKTIADITPGLRVLRSIKSPEEKAAAGKDEL